MTLLNEIKRAKSRVFRRLCIKRRDPGTGLFESEWQDLTNDVKKWGKVTVEVDAIRRSKFKFSGMNIVLANNDGKYSSTDQENSIWYNYVTPIRTLCKVECGFLNQSLTSNLWTNTEFPTVSSVFFGVVSNDLLKSDKNESVLKIAPVNKVFRDFPVRKLRGLKESVTAQEFMENLRDQTDGSGSFVFRPFFGNTSTGITSAGFNIAATSFTYNGMGPSLDEDFIGLNVWEAIETLAETENMVPYVDRFGVFNFVSTTANTISSLFNFVGEGFYDGAYGRTIKNIQSYGRDINIYHSRVAVRWNEADTFGSVQVVEDSLTVDGLNRIWNFGHKTLDIDNKFIPLSSTAYSIAQSIFNNVTALKNKIKFTTSLIPHLKPLDRVNISYDNSQISAASRWDLNNWSTSTSDELVWDPYDGEGIKIQGVDFFLLRSEIDLDNMQSTFIAKEI